MVRRSTRLPCTTSSSRSPNNPPRFSPARRRRSAVPAAVLTISAITFCSARRLRHSAVSGFRALACVGGHSCELVSRNGHVFKSWPQLADESHMPYARTALFSTERLAVWIQTVAATSETCCSAETVGVLCLRSVDSRREGSAIVTAARAQRRLLTKMPRGACRLLYLDHIQERGCYLFAEACARDLEGIVAKWAAGTYQRDSRSGSGSV